MKIIAHDFRGPGHELQTQFEIALPAHWGHVLSQIACLIEDWFEHAH